MARKSKAEGATPRPTKQGATPRSAKTADKGATPKSSLTKKTHPTEKFTRHQVIHALTESAGIISAAARMLRCDRDTVSNYIKRYPEVAEAVERAGEEVLDAAEIGLVGYLNDTKHPTLRLKAIEFYLRTKGKNRGFTMGTELTGKNGAPIETQNKVTFSAAGLSADEIAELEKHALVAVKTAAAAATR